MPQPNTLPTYEERQTAMRLVTSAHTYNAVRRRVDAWLVSGYATEEQRGALADWITVDLGEDGE